MARNRAPSGRRVLTDATVDGFAEQVGVAGVPAVLLDQVADESAQAGVMTVAIGGVGELVEPAARQRLVEPYAGSFDGAVPEGVELVRGCRRRRS